MPKRLLKVINWCERSSKKEKVKQMKLTMDVILLMNALEKISMVSAKDCVINGDIISFLVNEKDVGKAIGKKAVNVKELEKRLGKRIEIIGFSGKADEDIAKTFEVAIESAKSSNNTIIISLDALNKKKILSASGRFKRVKELIKRNYEMDVVLN